jgi:hypothetical protein
MVCVPIPMNPGYRCECRPGFRLIEDNNVEQRMVCQQCEFTENESILLQVYLFKKYKTSAAKRILIDCLQWNNQRTLCCLRLPTDQLLLPPPCNRANASGMINAINGVGNAKLGLL